MNRDENMEIGTWSICGTNDSKVMKILGSNEERKNRSVLPCLQEVSHDGHYMARVQ